ncbi:hypothetical protein GOB34_04215 [Sinorhizobium meliloti]|nr:hypothetical protein [Sinorhizobium meliloti]
MVRDISGEYLATTAGLRAPRTVYVAKVEDGYQIARLWACPYRIWELTSGPWRTGPLVSECFFILNWGIELIYALRFRETISEQARGRLAACHGGSTDVEGTISRIEQSLLENVARAAARSLQLLPFAFHLANASYSGETSGFDRISCSTENATPRRLGILCALYDTWAASSWIRAASGAGTIPFCRHLKSFQEIFSSICSEHMADPFFLRSSDIDVLFRNEGNKLLSHPLRQLPFSVRQDGDIQRFTEAAEVFFAGLSSIFNGELKDVKQMNRWLDQVDFEAIEGQRIFQWFSGDISGNRRTAYRQKLRQHHQVFYYFNT